MQITSISTLNVREGETKETRERRREKRKGGGGKRRPVKRHYDKLQYVTMTD